MRVSLRIGVSYVRDTKERAVHLPLSGWRFSMQLDHWVGRFLNKTRISTVSHSFPKSPVSALTFTLHPHNICIQTMCGMRRSSDQELIKVRPVFSVWEDPGAITFWQGVASPQTRDLARWNDSTHSASYVILITCIIAKHVGIARTFALSSSRSGVPRAFTTVAIVAIRDTGSYFGTVRGRVDRLAVKNDANGVHSWSLRRTRVPFMTPFRGLHSACWMHSYCEQSPDSNRHPCSISGTRRESTSLPTSYNSCSARGRGVDYPRSLNSLDPTCPPELSTRSRWDSRLRFHPVPSEPGERYEVATHISRRGSNVAIQVSSPVFRLGLQCWRLVRFSSHALVVPAFGPLLVELDLCAWSRCQFNSFSGSWHPRSSSRHYKRATRKKESSPPAIGLFARQAFGDVDPMNERGRSVSDRASGLTSCEWDQNASE